MKIKVYMRDWFYNAGIVGFLRILEKNEDEFAIMNENYIEFDISNLRKFHNYYFDYFIDIYNIARKTKDRMERTYNALNSIFIEKNEEKENIKKQKEKIKQEKKYIKNIIKTQLDKIEKFDSDSYKLLLEKYNEIDNINSQEDLEKFHNIIETIGEKLSDKNINNRLTLNFFKSILSKSYFGQVSFLNVSKSSLSYEEQKELFYKDYVSNIVETAFLNDIINNNYSYEAIQDYIGNSFNNNLLTDKMTKIYLKIQKLKTIEQIHDYIVNKIFSICYMCENDHLTVNQYSESNFLPLAISSDNMSNFFWNQNVKFPICDICKLMLFCIPVGITSITKIVKENNGENLLYKEKELFSFVNYDTNIQHLYRENNFFSDIAKKDNKENNPYVRLLMNIVNQEKKISNWQLQNIFIVEFEAEYLSYSRLEYFNIRKYVAEFFVTYADNSLNKIRDYRYKIQLVDYILKDKDIKTIIHDRIRQDIISNRSDHNSFLAIKVRMILNSLKKEKYEMMESNNDKLSDLYNIGISIYRQFQKNNEENKLNGYTYKMLNSIKSGNKKEFLDIIIRLHMYVGKEVSINFLDVMKDEGLDFESIGHSFVSGLIPKKFENS